MSTGYQELAVDAGEEWQPPADDRIHQEIEEIYDQLRDVDEAAEDRRDLRDIPTYTIDPEGAKDFDDAIAVQKEYDDGSLSGYRAWVHIADVPHYIDDDGAIDAVVQRRAFTEYRPEPVTHMLPEDLVQKFSLVEGRDQLANTIELQFDDDGAVETYDIYRSVIETDRNLSYEQANSYATMPSGSPALGARGEELVHDLEELSFLTRRLASQAGRTHTDREPAYRIVEELMLTANELGADALRQNDTGIYRVHDGVHEEAEYTPHCDRHAGLDTEPYAHFTAPIRRYSDIINWRLYWDEFGGSDDDLERIADHLNRREAAIEQHESTVDEIEVVGLDR